MTAGLLTAGNKSRTVLVAERRASDGQRICSKTLRGLRAERLALGLGKGGKFVSTFREANQSSPAAFRMIDSRSLCRLSSQAGLH
jgi:hypothetical protein